MTETNYTATLINKIDDVNKQDNEGNTALMIAMWDKQFATVKKLLKHPGINVNLQNENGTTALMFAALSNNVNIVNELLKRKDLDVNKQDAFGETALMKAAWNRNIAIVEKFLKHPNIDVNLQNPGGYTASDFAKRNYSLFIVTLIKNFNKKAMEKEPVCNYDTIIAVAVNGKIFVMWYDKENCHPSFDKKLIDERLWNWSLESGVYSVKYAVDSDVDRCFDETTYKKLWGLDDKIPE